MKSPFLALLGLILLSTPLAAPAERYGDFTYTSDGSAITITAYNGSGGAVAIPSSLPDTNICDCWLPVTAIGSGAFEGCTNLTSTALPNSVTSIGHAAFYNCTDLAGITIPGRLTGIGSWSFGFCSSLTNVTIPGGVTWLGVYAFAHCSGLTSITISGGVTSIGHYAFQACTSLTGVTIPGTVTNIGDYAFADCTNLLYVTIPGSVISIGNGAFYNCTGLIGAFFEGNAPSFGPEAFTGDNNATVFYLPDTTDWGPTFDGCPTTLWNPLMQCSDVGPSGFGFNITGTAEIPLVIEAATNLTDTSWVPLQSLSLTNGAVYFSDPDRTNYPARFYRIRSP